MSALATRIAEPDLARLPEWQVAAALNAPDPNLQLRRRNVPTNEAKNVLRLTGEWGAVVLLSRQTVAIDAPEARAVAMAITVVDTLTETTELGTTDETHWLAMQAMVAGLQQAGVISEASATGLLALAYEPQSWAQANGFPRGITADDVGAARS